jgi:hypothetical protein
MFPMDPARRRLKGSLKPARRLVCREIRLASVAIMALVGYDVYDPIDGSRIASSPTPNRQSPRSSASARAIDTVGEYHDAADGAKKSPLAQLRRISVCSRALRHPSSRRGSTKVTAPETSRSR